MLATQQTRHGEQRSRKLEYSYKHITHTHTQEQRVNEIEILSGGRNRGEADRDGSERN